MAGERNERKSFHRYLFILFEFWITCGCYLHSYTEHCMYIQNTAPYLEHDLGSLLSLKSLRSKEAKGAEISEFPERYDHGYYSAVKSLRLILSELRSSTAQPSPEELMLNCLVSGPQGFKQLSAPCVWRCQGTPRDPASLLFTCCGLSGHRYSQRWGRFGDSGEGAKWAPWCWVTSAPGAKMSPWKNEGMETQGLSTQPVVSGCWK